MALHARFRISNTVNATTISNLNNPNYNPYSPEAAYAGAPEQSDEIDLREILGFTWAMRLWIILVSGAVTGLAVLYALVAEPVYQSQAMLLVEPDKRLSGGAGFDITSAILAPSYNLPAELEVLRSRSVAQATIQKLGLSITAQPKRFPFIGDYFARKHEEANEDLAPPLLGFTGYAWGGEKITVTTLEVPRALLGANLTLVAGADQSFQLLDEDEVVAEGTVGVLAPITTKKVRGAQGSETNGILITELVASPGTEFVVRRGPPTSLEDNLRNSIGAREKARGSGVMEVSINSSSPQQAQETLRVVIDSYIEQNIERRSEEAIKTLEFLEKQIPEFRRDLSDQERRLAELRARTGLINPLDGSQDRQDEVRIRTQLELLKLERNALASRYEAGFSGFAVLDDKIKTLEADLSKYKRAYLSLPKRELELVQTARDVEVGREILLVLLNKVEELKIAKAGSVSSVRVIDDASFSREPIAPNRSRIVALGIALGLVLGVLAVWFYRVFLRGIKNPAEVEANLRAPVLSTITHSSRQDEIVERIGRGEPVKPLSVEFPTDMAVESLRSLRTSLLFLMSDKANNRLLVSGPMPRMGKTFISANLGTVLSEIGKRVVVVDCDLRRGLLHETFGEKRATGLTQVLMGEASLNEALRKEESSGIHFLTGGKLPPNPTDLLSSEAFVKLLDELSARFDVVILDSAPILAVTDAAIVAPLCATVLMVVKQHELQRSDLENSRKRLDQVGVSITGAVINDLPTRGQGYYYYYYYAYQGYYNRYENRYGNAYVSADGKQLPRWKRIFNKLFM